MCFWILFSSGLILSISKKLNYRRGYIVNAVRIKRINGKLEKFTYHFAFSEFFLSSIYFYKLLLILCFQLTSSVVHTTIRIVCSTDIEILFLILTCFFNIILNRKKYI